MTDFIAEAKALEAKARDAFQRAHDSFERSDTDGCVTQWASEWTGHLAQRQASILRDGKRDSFRGLFEGDRRVAARLITTQFGTSWLLRDDEAEKFGRTFIPQGDRSRVQKALGLHEAREHAPAWAKLESNGRGLGANVWVQTFRTGCKWGSDAVKE